MRAPRKCYCVVVLAGGGEVGVVDDVVEVVLDGVEGAAAGDQACLIAATPYSEPTPAPDR